MPYCQFGDVVLGQLDFFNQPVRIIMKLSELLPLLINEHPSHLDAKLVENFANFLECVELFYDVFEEPDAADQTRNVFLDLSKGSVHLLDFRQGVRIACLELLQLGCSNKELLQR